MNSGQICLNFSPSFFLWLHLATLRKNLTTHPKCDKCCKKVQPKWWWNWTGKILHPDYVSWSFYLENLEGEIKLTFDVLSHLFKLKQFCFLSVGMNIHLWKCTLKLSCDSRFQCAFAACSCVFKEITLLWPNQSNFFENKTTCSKRMRKNARRNAALF